ncbi:MAG TPA: hypothetical protein VKV24_07675 [Casimicrobiaceae bacterium]|nr:hypothetical protein [Casimicrobiaceae bacterium]
MEPRLDLSAVSPGTIKPLLDIEAYLAKSGLEPSLLNLVKMPRVAETHAPDDVYREARAQFSAQELADLTLAIVAINGWNRIAIGFRSVPGTYQSRKRARAGVVAEH